MEIYRKRTYRRIQNWSPFVSTWSSGRDNGDQKLVIHTKNTNYRENLFNDSSSKCSKSIPSRLSNTQARYQSVAVFDRPCAKFAKRLEILGAFPTSNPVTACNVLAIAYLRPIFDRHKPLTSFKNHKQYAMFALEAWSGSTFLPLYQAPNTFHFPS